MADCVNGKPIAAMKVTELQQELQRRGMNKNGRKSELVERLRKSLEGEEEDRITQTLSGEDALLSGKDEALTTSADDAFVSTDEALATTEDEIQPDSTCTAGNASECMLPQVSSSTEGAGPKGGGSSAVEGAERMDGDGVLEVHLVEKDLQEFADEGVGDERGVSDHQKMESPMAKRRKLHLAASQSAGSGGKRKSSTTPTTPGAGRVSVAGLKEQREAEADMDVTPPLDGKDDASSPRVTMPTSTPPEGGGSGGVRRSISIEVDEGYEKLRKEKEREREDLRHKIELQKKEQAKTEAREAEERRVLRAKELEEKQVKQAEQQQQQVSHNAVSSADEKSQRMEAKKHREDLRHSMEEVRERRRSEARNRLSVEEKLELAPPRGDPSHVLHIQHLTRPFTNQQLMELLSEEGSLLDGAFWTDKRKSYCYAAFRTANEACVVAKRLHGLKWPSHNKRPLEVEYVSTEEARKGSNGLFEAPAMSQLRDETPPLEEQEAARAGQGQVGVAGQDQEEQVPKQDIQVSQATEEHPEEREAAEVCPPPPPVQTAPPREEEEGNTLDKLFRKTVAKPHIYWLPLTEEQALRHVEEDQQREKDRESRQREREAREKEAQRSRDRGVRSRQDRR